MKLYGNWSEYTFKMKGEYNNDHSPSTMETLVMRTRDVDF